MAAKAIGGSLRTDPFNTDLHPRLDQLLHCSTSMPAIRTRKGAYFHVLHRAGACGSTAISGILGCLSWEVSTGHLRIPQLSKVYLGPLDSTRLSRPSCRDMMMACSSKPSAQAFGGCCILRNCAPAGAPRAPRRLARARNHGDLPENTTLAGTSRTLPAGWGCATAVRHWRPCLSRISALAKTLERRIWQMCLCLELQGDKQVLSALPSGRFLEVCNSRADCDRPLSKQIQSALKTMARLKKSQEPRNSQTARVLRFASLR